MKRKEQQEQIEIRCRLVAEYMFINDATVRETAKKFGISKTTVYEDVTERLEKSNKYLWKLVQEVLAINKAERHIRGGMATKRKYEALRKRA